MESMAWISLVNRKKVNTTKCDFERSHRDCSGFEIHWNWRGRSGSVKTKMRFEQLNKTETHYVPSLVCMEMFDSLLFNELIKFINHCGLIPIENMKEINVSALWMKISKGLHMSIFVNGSSTFIRTFLFFDVCWSVYLAHFYMMFTVKFPSHLISSHFMWFLVYFPFADGVDFIFSHAKREKNGLWACQNPDVLHS